VELQQRSCEYANIFARPDSSSLRGALLERMPAAEGDLADAEGSEQAAEVVTAQSLISLAPSAAANGAHDPLDIMKQLFGDLPSSSSSAPVAAPSGTHHPPPRRALVGGAHDG
jgi:hypothetical protein